MAKKPTARQEFVLFNVIYEDGSQRSNRKVPADIAMQIGSQWWCLRRGGFRR